MSRYRLTCFSYKALHSIVPCLLLTMSVGMIYSFSLFIGEFSDILGSDRNSVQLSFNLSIFFLGIGAAFFGPLVEKNIRLASAIATVLFASGLGMTALAAHFRNLWMLYAGIGVLCGIGEGIAYLSPCKNMLLWYSRSRFKGLVMAVSIVTFGLGSSLCAQIYGLLYPRFGLTVTLASLTAIYFVMMSTGSVLIRKPRFDKMIKRKAVSVMSPSPLSYLRDAYVLRHWAFMFLNISMGLILIGSCASILSDAGMSPSGIVLIMSICGIANGIGRIVFPVIGDLMSRKGTVLLLILLLEILIIAPASLYYAIIPLSVIFINATYGGGFATCPQIILERYGKQPLSVIHGIVLSAWGMASIFAFVCTSVICSLNSGYRTIPIVLMSVYAIAIPITSTIWKRRKDA